MLWAVPSPAPLSLHVLQRLLFHFGYRRHTTYMRMHRSKNTKKKVKNYTVWQRRRRIYAINFSCCISFFTFHEVRFSVLFIIYHLSFAPIHRVRTQSTFAARTHSLRRPTPRTRSGKQKSAVKSQEQPIVCGCQQMPQNIISIFISSASFRSTSLLFTYNTYFSSSRPRVRLEMFLLLNYKISFVLLRLFVFRCGSFVFSVFV